MVRNETNGQYVFNHLHGEVTVKQDWIAELRCNLFVTMIYQDSYFDVQENYQLQRLLLDDVA